MDFHIKNSSLDSRENRLPSISSRDNNPNQRESFKTNNSLQNQSSINCGKIFIFLSFFLSCKNIIK